MKEVVVEQIHSCLPWHKGSDGYVSMKSNTDEFVSCNCCVYRSLGWNVILWPRSVKLSGVSRASVTEKDVFTKGKLPDMPLCNCWQDKNSPCLLPF